MKTTKNGALVTVSLDGSIGETTALFTLPLAGVKELTFDMSGVTSINSIGVKHWILWTLKIPPDCTVKLANAPYMFASQACSVVGFMGKTMFFQSIKLPYVCDDCGFEDNYLGVRGKDFEYAAEGKPSVISVPKELPCPKCKEVKFEPDFFNEKTFAFLG